MDKLQNLVAAAAQVYLALPHDADGKVKDAAFQVWHELEKELTEEEQKEVTR